MIINRSNVGFVDTFPLIIGCGINNLTDKNNNFWVSRIEYNQQSQQ